MRAFKKEITVAVGFLTFLTPLVAFAVLDGVRGLLAQIVAIVNILIPLVMALAVLAFFWGLVKFLWGGVGDAAGKEKQNGRSLMIYGIIALFVMVAVWGIIQFIARNLGIGTGGSITPPTVNTLS